MLTSVTWIMVLHVHLYNYWFWLNYKNMIKVISDEKKNYATSGAEHTVIVWHSLTPCRKIPILQIMPIHKGENTFTVHEHLYHSKWIPWDNIVMYTKHCCLGFNFYLKSSYQFTLIRLTHYFNSSTKDKHKLETFVSQHTTWVWAREVEVWIHTEYSSICEML